MQRKEASAWTQRWKYSLWMGILWTLFVLGSVVGMEALISAGQFALLGFLLPCWVVTIKWLTQ